MSIAGFLNCSLNNIWPFDMPLRYTLDLMERIRLAADKARIIWGNSAQFVGGFPQVFGRTAEKEKQVRRGLEQGKYTLDTCLHLDDA